MAPMGRVEGFEAEGQDLGFGAWKLGFRSFFPVESVENFWD